MWDMIVNDVTQFHKYHLGVGGMLECVCMCVCVFVHACVRACMLCVCVCRVSYRMFGGTPKFGVDVEGMYST